MTARETILGTNLVRDLSRGSLPISSNGDRLEAMGTTSKLLDNLHQHIDTHEIIDLGHTAEFMATIYRQTINKRIFLNAKNKTPTKSAFELTFPQAPCPAS